MSLFHKTLASLGLGGARVDTVLETEVLLPGQSLPVRIDVKGGKVAQAVDNIHLYLCCRYEDEVPVSRGDSEHRMEKVQQTYTLAQWSLPEAFTLRAGEQRQFECRFELPVNTPITIGDSGVWLETHLEIPLALDPKDKDPLTIRPDPLLDAVFTALEQAGFRLLQVECEATDGFALPFVQVFEFVPVSGPYHGRWRELELITQVDGDHLTLWFAIDRRQRGVSGMLARLLGGGELKRQLAIPLTIDPMDIGEQVLAYLAQVDDP
ncbi:sporulation protein [Photobacterium galatheae]|uniref:Gram-positive sporulation control protein Spo0M n=1 Tax=Photobacterium galatheae TaxID=1654360 RepID=A0A066RVJ7_9GAMM|nr:sporulation protein [Photobacterium galatheae]KDM91413.1 Gram-positive sporulation control protein Spo0M [Photobacterium galatheae]MCM0151094.1 sporulation protein [Photobacterium galatheae]